MDKIDCLKCVHWEGGQFECEYNFRWAANAGGRGVDCREDVWFCQDYEEIPKDEEEDKDDV
ncbi:MAG: hypothetical protein LBI03_05920 [Clostridiales bacterium]|jgi:hypothetical protein|nr:hypothetical protein [Clostridiales bacterium]